MTETIPVPITVAARKGVSALPGMAAEKRVVLTSHGRPVAVVDSAQRADETQRHLNEAAWAVLDWAGERVGSCCAEFSLDDVCARLGFDPETIRARAAEHAHQ